MVFGEGRWSVWVRVWVARGDYGDGIIETLTNSDGFSHCGAGDFRGPAYGLHSWITLSTRSNTANITR